MCSIQTLAAQQKIGRFHKVITQAQLKDIELRVSKKLAELFFSGCTVSEAYSSLGAISSRQKLAACDIAKLAGFDSIDVMRAECLAAGRASVKVKLMQTVANAGSPSDIQRISEKIHGDGTDDMRSFGDVVYSEELLAEAVRYLSENPSQEAQRQKNEPV